MKDSKKGAHPFRMGIKLSRDDCPKTSDERDDCPKTSEERERMKYVHYASVVGSLMYVMLCTRPGICFAVGMVSRYQSNPGLNH